MTPKNCTIVCYMNSGWIAGDVEVRKSRKLVFDLFGLGDVLAFNPEYTVLIQAGHTNGHLMHHRKILELEPTVRLWLAPESRGLNLVSWSTDRKRSRTRTYWIEGDKWKGKLQWRDIIAKHEEDSPWLRNPSKHSSPAPSR